MNLVHTCWLQISPVIEIDTESRYAFMHIRLLYILITGENPITSQHWFEPARNSTHDFV
jgi:hypothetical protein